MKGKPFKYLITLLSAVFCCTMQAQNTMHIKENSGAITSYPLTDIRKLTFQSGNMIVLQNNNSSVPFALTNTSNFHFENIPVGISTIKDEEITKLFIFPNPGSNEIHLNYEALESRVIKIEIIDAKGNSIQQQEEKSIKGKNSVTINVSKFTQGLYLFRVYNVYDAETINFLKN